MKAKTKSKKADIIKQSKKTGGGPPPEDLDSGEEKIIQIIGNTVIEGQDVPESTIRFNWDGDSSSQLPAELLEPTEEQVEEKKERILPEEKPQFSRKRKARPAERLDKSLKASEQLVKLTTEKNKMKEKYYKKKIILLERQLKAK